MGAKNSIVLKNIKRYRFSQKKSKNIPFLPSKGGGETLLLVIDPHRAGAGKQFSSTGHVAPLFVSRGPNFSQKCLFKAKKLTLAGRMWPAGLMLPPLDIECVIHKSAKKLSSII